MKVHWGWVAAGVVVGYVVLPKVLPALKGATGSSTRKA